MRVLILSGNTGEGHNSSAKAIKEVFDARGEICVIEDALRFISEITSKIISKGHVFAYNRLPYLFNRGYVFAEKHEKLFGSKSFLYTFFSQGSDALKKVIVDGNYDAVICVHAFAALMLTETQKRYKLPIKTAFLATDYTCSPSVKDLKLDYCFIPDKLLTMDFCCPNIPRKSIIASGIPIRQMFYSGINNDEAKSKLGLDRDCKHTIMMCGSMGCGPIKKITELFAEDNELNIMLSVICGTNKRLQNTLEMEFSGNKNIKIYGYVKNMSLMLDSADLYMTKPGGISTTEAMAKNLPMAFINVVGGCEERNRQFFCDNGIAVSGGDARELVDICKRLLSGDEMYNRIKEKLVARERQNAAETIYETMKNK